jgi:uncharacterized protein YjbI with pentapeptide repeats
VPHRVKTGLPRKPVQPTSLDPAGPEHDLVNDAEYRMLGFLDSDLAGRSATSVELTQCRFTDVDLSGTTLDRAVFTDCVVDTSNLANLRADNSSLLRVELSALRMTGFHWTGGLLHDVRFAGSRMDLSVFRFTDFAARVLFERCNLAGADFANADLGGVQFLECDLSGAQFSHARMEGTRFTECTLVDIGGVTSWQGAIVRSHDIVALSYTLAAALGITIVDDD